MRVQLIFGAGVGLYPKGGTGITVHYTIRTRRPQGEEKRFTPGDGERAIRDIAIVEVGYGGGGRGEKVTEQGRLITERVSAKHENEEKNDGSKHDERSLSGVI